MRVYIPLASSGKQRQYVSGEVRDALKAQTVPCEIVECVTEGEIHSQRNYSPARIKGEVTSRNDCIQQAITSGDEYFIMADRDRVPIPSTIADLQTAIIANAAIGMVSAVESRHCKWPDIGFIICRSEVFKQLSIVNLYGGCLCREVNEAIEKMGFKATIITGNYTKEV
jgi:hypothetical protein